MLVEKLHKLVGPIFDPFGVCPLVFAGNDVAGVIGGEFSRAIRDGIERACFQGCGWGVQKTRQLVVGRQHAIHLPAQFGFAAMFVQIRGPFTRRQCKC